jgi:hypothetical protein
MTETSFTQANPAFVPRTDDPEPEVDVIEVFEMGNVEPIAVYEQPAEEPQPVDEPVDELDEAPVEENDVEEEPPADEE